MDKIRFKRTAFQYSGSKWMAQSFFRMVLVSEKWGLQNVAGSAKQDFLKINGV